MRRMPQAVPRRSPLIAALAAALLCVGVAAHAGDAERGAVLAALGGCASCHTAPDGARYAGGHAIETDFGTFFGTNLTPDPVHGLGGWTEVDFVRAMRRGRAPDGTPYYPAFPYTSYTGITDADLADLWAFLVEVLPDPRPDTPHALRGIYRARGLVLAFFRPSQFRRGPFEPEPERDEAWNRGAYLVRHVGHCGECHTPRNALGGLKRRWELAGFEGLPESAPNLTPHPDGLGAWSEGDVLDLLHLGMLPSGDVVGGGMTDVVFEGTAKLSSEDRRAMAAYLATIRPRPSR